MRKLAAVALAVVLAQFVIIAPKVQAAQKPEATKVGIGIHEAWWQKTSIEVGVGIYMWFYDRFHNPTTWRSTGARSEPQRNKKAPGSISASGDLSE